MSPVVADRSAADLDSYQGMQPKPEGTIEFAALMRKLDKGGMRLIPPYGA